jgi:outer membrane receptor protein involved in Fe transport
MSGKLGSFLNSDERIEAYGGELIGTFQPLAHIKISLSYGYVQLDHAELMQYPVHQIKLNTLYFVNDKLSFGLNYLYNNSYSKSDLPLADDIYRRDRHVVDMSLNYKANKNLDIGVSVSNIFKTDVPPMVFDPDRLNRGGLGFDERRIYLSLSLKL